MPKELKVAVFDLDGTLADTANITLLTQGVRSPYDVLSLTPPMDNQKRLLFDNSMIYKISYLIQCGIHVYLITRAPKPYASTLAYLLGIDFCGLIPSNPTLTTVESKLAHISEITGADKSEMLYIGDLEDDHERARKFGCICQYPTWTREHIEKTDLISPWFNLCYYRTIREDGATGVAKTLESKYEERLRRHDLITNSFEREYSFNESFSLCDSNGKVLLNDIFRVPNDSDIVMKPFVNPHIFTRFEYESDENLRNKLFDLIVLAGLAPARIKSPHSDGPDVLAEIELYASVNYWLEGFGSTLWGLIKNWSQSKGSGPKVHLHYMELVALGIAAGINSQRLENEFAFLVPVPSTRISQEHPGQVSFRLSHRISQLTEIPLLNLMIKNEQGEFIPTMERYPFSRSIYLIDDQITSGKNARKCVEVLHKMGVTDIKIFAWSASKFELIVD
jgi:hypothetical protein